MKTFLFALLILLSGSPFFCQEKPKYYLAVSVRNAPELQKRFTVTWNTVDRARKETYLTPMIFELTEIPVILSLSAENDLTILKAEVTQIYKKKSSVMFWGANWAGTVFILSEESMGYIPTQ
ncbi:MAG: hypothetical protein H3C35_11345 [Bacteroidetes bacterium]|nr:hypothetical protein [Bacteroidota bacterium]